MNIYLNLSTTNRPLALFYKKKRKKSYDRDWQFSRRSVRMDSFTARSPSLSCSSHQACKLFRSQQRRHRFRVCKSRAFCIRSTPNPVSPQRNFPPLVCARCCCLYGPVHSCVSLRRPMCCYSCRDAGVPPHFDVFVCIPSSMEKNPVELLQPIRVLTALVMISAVYNVACVRTYTFSMLVNSRPYLRVPTAA